MADVFSDLLVDYWLPRREFDVLVPVYGPVENAIVKSFRASATKRREAPTPSDRELSSELATYYSHQTSHTLEVRKFSSFAEAHALNGDPSTNITRSPRVVNSSMWALLAAA